MTRLASLLLFCLPLLTLAAEPEVRVQSRLVPVDSVVVGGSIGLEVDLLVDTWFTAAPILPRLDLPDAVVTPPSGEAQKLTEQQDGKTFFGLRYTYQITPQLVRRYEIPVLEFQVRPGQASGALKVTSQPLQFEVKDLAGAAGGHALVARNVSFIQSIQRSHDPLRQGDSITRRLSIQAEGAQAMLIPPPVFVEVKGLKRYVQTPEVKPLGDGRGGSTGGARVDSVTYVIGEAGRYSLPAVELEWRDAETGAAHRLSVSAVELEAVRSSYQMPFSISEDLRDLKQKVQVTTSGHRLLLSVLLVLGGALVYFGRPWFRASLEQLKLWKAARRQAWLDSDVHAWRLARQQLQERPAQLGGLYLYVRRSTGSLTLTEMTRALRGGSEERLRALLRAWFGGERVTGHAPPEPMRVLADVRQAVSEQKKTVRTRQGLKPLNP